MINSKSGLGKNVLTAALVVLLFTAFSAVVVSAAPNCTLKSIDPDNIEANSTGPFVACINCTDSDGINTSRFFITKTVEGFLNPEVPNRWSIRPPPNNISQSDGVVPQQILLADGRGHGHWYDSYGLFTENYSYAVNDNDSMRVTITNGSNWALLNYSYKVEPTSFRSSVFLSRGKMEKEEKKD
ncbi:MAG: hypothetical protein U9O85_06300, partial [Euryarchaeota archaeon]|nr:hypothetical protein [Euryarchaeota archaeon]